MNEKTAGVLCVRFRLQGIRLDTPREVLKRAFKIGVIEDEAGRLTLHSVPVLSAFDEEKSFSASIAAGTLSVKSAAFCLLGSFPNCFSFTTYNATQGGFAKVLEIYFFNSQNSTPICNRKSV